jgi:murein DD-endopeptidase MepM/ murein hydrolase activator NlpD
LALLIVLVACSPTPPQLTPFAASAPTTQLVHLRVDTRAPTQTARALFPSATVTQTAVPTLFPSLTMTPTLDANAPTWTPLPSWTPPPVPAVVQLQAYFLLNWPIANSGAHTLARAYPYGATNNGRLQVHHGVDLVNALETPLFAAADGTVIYAGDDFTTVFGSDTNYYGNLVVIQHNFLSTEQLPVFTLYGHMENIGVQAGQVVLAGSMIGTVGQSGIARGPHLHFEVRVGNAFDFAATRNPELWLHPFPGQGLLAGRVTDAAGALLTGITLKVQSNDLTRNAYTYADTTVNSDPLLGENFTLGDLPPNYYVVSVTLNGRERFSQSVYVQPDQMTWLDVMLENEFSGNEKGKSTDSP